MSTNKFVGATFLERLHHVVNEKLNGKWAELARKTGLTPSTIHQIKMGSEPKLSSLQRIGMALDISLDWLISGEGSMYKAEPSEESLSKRHEALLTMFDGLSDEQKREILTSAQEKERMNKLEEMLVEVLKKVG